MFRRFIGLLLLLVILTGVTGYVLLTDRQQAPERALQYQITLRVVEALATLEQHKLAMQQQAFDLQRAQLADQQQAIPIYRQIKTSALIGSLLVAWLAMLIVVIYAGRSHLRRNSVCVAKIGPHSAIPVHHDDLKQFYPIAVNLSLAEIEASISTSHDNAYTISRQMIADLTTYTRALASQRGVFGKEPADEMPPRCAVAGTAIPPTCADLLQRDQIAPGKPLIFGYHQGQPEYRDLKNLKSLAIAGWQGSGKTSSAAFIIGTSVLAYNVEAYVIDPHKQHDEGLYRLIQPLEQTGRVTVINPFDTHALIHTIQTRLNNRLRGDESSDRPILFVIDELARLAKLDCFDELVVLLERCTEETRKANIVFLGISTKWTARHFKGRADIRGCMNSALVHKCKPSQAELLLEDRRDQKLVEHLEHPGDAILVTDYAGAKPVAMPFCTRQDMQTIATRLGRTADQITVAPPPHSPPGRGEGGVAGADNAPVTETHPQPRPGGELTASPPTLRDRVKALLTTKVISYGDIKDRAGIAKSSAYNFVHGIGNLAPEQQTRLETYLERLHEPPASVLEPPVNERSTPLADIVNAAERNAVVNT
jgi:hypothetical protein